MPGACSPTSAGGLYPGTQTATGPATTRRLGAQGGEEGVSLNLHEEQRQQRGAVPQAAEHV
jgi:hypothetical protein